MIKRLAKLCLKNPISVSEYVRECLYNPEIGYYSKSNLRVGGLGDFYTSSSVNPEVFGGLLAESALKIREKNFEDLENFETIEIGAEPQKGLFKNSKIIRFFDEPKISGDVFVFSNELLDAQPFDRFIFKNGEIFKTFVKFFEDGRYEISHKKASEFEQIYLQKNFPEIKSEFVLDFSFDALKLLRKICSQNWRGVLIFADYFRFKNELYEFEKGTARTYKRHRASSDIFLNPYECDITFSPSVEVFISELKSMGLTQVQCKSQGSFFMNYAQDYIKKIIESEDILSAKKRAISELISPVHMGEMFRVMSAVKL